MKKLQLIWNIPVLVLAALTLVLQVPANAAPASDLWDRWAAHDESSQRSIDHTEWSSILRIVSSVGGDDVRRLDYGAVSGGLKARLDGYVSMLEGVPVSELNRAEQFAYWVNLYNALTVKVVSEHYPVKSIRDIDISPGFFSDGPWGAMLATVEGEAVSLDDIEHRILRPIWRDPRVHYAVNCASIGCPDLAPSAYTGFDLDSQLDRAARRFVNHPRGASFVDGELVVSKIYTWFEEDFETADLKGEAGILAHLRQYASGRLFESLNGVNSIDQYEYDWSLNSRAQRNANAKSEKPKRSTRGS